MTRVAPQEEEVVLVDEHDTVVGRSAKLRAHTLGILHRAFSVFVTDRHGRLLLQRRAWGKYHSGGLWTNSCCGHPRPGEDTQLAATRRLAEEMSIVCVLQEVGRFSYRADVGSGLVENEIDHVFLGRADMLPRPDPSEASEWRWTSLQDVDRELARTPEQFTAWFAPALEQVRPALLTGAK